MSDIPEALTHRRRRIRLAAAVGAVAAVGVGALVAHDLLTPAPAGVNQAGVSQGSAPEPSVTPSGAASPTPSPSGGPGPHPAPKKSILVYSPPPTASPIRPLAAPEDVPAKVVSYHPAEGRTVRIVTARGNLTGQREMTWAGDKGHPVGAARCTRKFKLSPDAPAAVRPTMLLCWRLSDSRSVYVIAIDSQGRPSESETAAILGREWKKLA